MPTDAFSQPALAAVTMSQMKCTVGGVAAVALLLLAPERAQSQSTAVADVPGGPDALLPRAYLQAGVELAVYPEGPGYLRVDSAVDGVAPGVVLAGGVRLAPSVAFELEASLDRAITTPLRYAYQVSVNFDGELRDSALHANLRWNPGRKYHFEMFVGGGLARSRYAQRSAIVTDRFGVRSTSADNETTFLQPGAAGGVSVPIHIGDVLAIIPTASYRWVRRPGEVAAAELGASRHVWRVGVAVRRHTRAR